MSPELEILDQLLGGGLPLTTIQQICPDAARLMSAVYGLVSAGDVRLVGVDGLEVPNWRWRELFKDGAALHQLDKFRLELTQQGAKRIC